MRFQYFCLKFLYIYIFYLGEFLSGFLGSIDFSQKNIYQIYKLLGNNDKKMNPNYYSKICPTTGLVLFFVKEPLEYLGLVIEKKTSLKKALLTLTGCIEYLNYCQEHIIAKKLK